MNLYIKYINGEIVDHPMLEENLRQVDPDFDPSNLPETLKVFERVTAPGHGPYVYLQASYQLDQDGIVRDAYTEVPFSTEERTQLVEHTLAQPHPKGWTFNETICGWVPGVPYPTDGKVYTWSEELENWQEIIPEPVPIPATAHTP